MGLGIGIAISPILSNTIGSGNPPINTVIPLITGDIGLGGELITTNGTWIGDPVIAYSYQWNRNGTAILGATNSTYTITISDSNKNITCTVTATNNIGSANATSNTISIPVFSAPSNTVDPAITGTAQEGQVVTCSTGTWTGTSPITYAYQWKRNGSNIGSATNSTYTLVTADVSQSITCQVTATNAVGSNNATSNTITPIAAFIGLLDTYSGAAVAYSFRKLSSIYSGNCIRVRRSSDNTEQDIGFVNNILDTTTLLSFVGSGSGYVTTWYDQSGNIRNATQTTAANQPIIVSSGTLILLNSKPSLRFDGSNDFLDCAYKPTTNIIAVESVQKFNAASGMSLSISEIGPQLYLQWANSGTTFANYYNNSNSNTAYSSNRILQSFYMQNGSGGFYQNGNLTISRTQGGTSSSAYNIIIGRWQSGGNFANCDHQEMILWQSDKSASRTGIQSNINNYYSIY